MISEVSVKALDLKRYEPLIGKRPFEAFTDVAAKVSDQLGNATVWNINSTAAGGGVAEMLYTLLGYAEDVGIRMRWLVIKGDSEFFKITKRIHNGIHDSLGDGGTLGPREEAHYQEVTDENWRYLQKFIKPGDYVLLHDPQTAGLAKPIREMGATVVWRSHIGHDHRSPLINRSWFFLKSFLDGYVDRYVFTRSAFVPDWVDKKRLAIIPPSIDPFSAKNQELDEATVESILYHVGIIQNPTHKLVPCEFLRKNGTTAEVERFADIMTAGPDPKGGEPLIVQVSRWDRLKDMLGVMNGFADYVSNHGGVNLALVGPNVMAVADDPEGAEAYNECVTAWRQLPHFKRRWVQLVCLPMRDLEENAVICNAIQRYATVVVQKSIYEGFGLTVAEAMWKGKAVVGTNVGGIADQINHRENGLLVNDPTDLAEFGRNVKELLNDDKFRETLGESAKKKVIENFMVPRHLGQYFELFEGIQHEKSHKE